MRYYFNDDFDFGGVGMGILLCFLRSLKICFLRGLKTSVYFFSALSCAAETRQAVGFETYGDDFSAAFVEFVSKYSVRQNHEIGVARTLPELVANVCGNISKANLNSFELALRGTGILANDSNQIDIGAWFSTAQVPSCLPSASDEWDVVSRLPVRYDTVTDYWVADFASPGVSVPFREDSHRGSASDLANINAQAASGTLDYAEITTPQVAYATIPRPTVDWNLSGYLNPDNSFVDEFVDRYAEERVLPYIAELVDDNYDASQIAWETFQVVRDLKNNGVGTDAAINIAAEATSGSMPRGTYQRVMDAVKRAEREYSGTNPPQFSDEVWGGQSIKFKTPNTGYLGMFRELNPAYAERSSNVLFVGEPTFSAEITAAYNFIPVDVQRIEKDNVQVPAVYGDSPDDGSVSASLIEDTIVAFSNVNKCDGPSIYQNWGNSEFNSRFKEAIARTKFWSFREYGFPDQRVTTVRVLDFGFVSDSVGTTPFLNKFFEDDMVGSENQPNKAHLNKIGYHGTAVTGLTMGGPQLWEVAPALGLQIKYAPRSVYVTSAEDEAPWVDLDKLRKAMRGDVDIINISLGGKGEGVFGKIRFERFLGFGKDLIVLAAGNRNLNNAGSTGIHLADAEIFPQQYAMDTKYRRNMLIVASFDGEKLAEFSNGHGDWVEIAAPGCGIETWGYGVNDELTTIAQNGTSFSAPIVTYVAAVVNSLSKPSERTSTSVKSRLLASADLREDIPASMVKDGRLLNPIKAVSLHHDYLEVYSDNTQTDTLHKIGKITTLFDGNTFCKSFNGSGAIKLLKFAMRPHATGSKDRVLYRLKNEEDFSQGDCEPTDSSIWFHELGRSEPEQIPVKMIHDLVFSQ